MGNKVLYIGIGTEPNEPARLKPWKEIAVYCKEGQKEWYKAVLPLGMLSIRRLKGLIRKIW